MRINKIVVAATLAIFSGQTFALKTAKMAPSTAHFLTMLNNNDTVPLKSRFNVRSLNSVKYVNAYVLMDDTADSTQFNKLGVQLHPMIKGIATARIPINSLDSMTRISSIKYLQIGSKIQQKMNIARSASTVDKVQAGVDLSGPYKGKNVVVGIIDQGFQYDHINFYRAAGDSTRIKRIWDQNVSGTAPTGYSYGVEYKTQAAMFAAKYDNSSVTHGTHVAGIAAGGDTNNSNAYFGVAPEADMVLVSYNVNEQSADNVSLSDGIKYIYDYATSVNKPCVVNMSLGTHYGPHDGTSMFDLVCDGLQGPGRLLVGAAGNEGADDLHLSKTFTASTDTLKTFFGFYASNYAGFADIWGDVNKNFQVQLVVYRKSTNQIVFASPFLDASSSSSNTYTLNSLTTGISGTVYLYTERNILNNKPNATIYPELTSISSGYYLGFRVVGQANTTVHSWADNNDCFYTGNSISGWSDGNSECSVGEIGGTGKKIISVGAYVSKETVKNINNLTLSGGQAFGGLTTFSSHGMTADGRVKPDITAPGSLVVSSFSSGVLNNPSFSNSFVKKNTVNGKDYYYGFMQGTSMASPFVAGVLASWLEAKKDLTPDEAREILKNTAIKDAYTGTIGISGSSTWGYGKIDAWNGLKACLQLTPVIEHNVVAELRMYPNPCVDHCKILFPASDVSVTVVLYSIEGQQLYTQSIGNVEAGSESSIQLAQLPKGIYVVQVNGKKQYATSRLIKN